MKLAVICAAVPYRKEFMAFIVTNRSDKNLEPLHSKKPGQ